MKTILKSKKQKTTNSSARLLIFFFFLKKKNCCLVLKRGIVDRKYRKNIKRSHTLTTICDKASQYSKGTKVAY